MATRTQRFIVLGAASVAFIAAGVLPAYALAASDPRSPHARRPGNERLGTVLAVNGSSITFSARDGSTYTVDASGAKILKQGASSDLSAVSIGDPIAVIGPRAGSAATATPMIDGHRAAKSHGVVVGGTIASAGPGSFTLQPKGHPDKAERPVLAVSTDAATVASRRGQAVGLEALAAGANVIVSGTRTSSTSILASKVLIRTP